MAARPTPSVAVVLVRGINVGGNHPLSMTDLRRVCTDAGCVDVATYIQSGNVVVRSRLRSAQLEATIEAGIAAVAGFDARVTVRTLPELTDLVEHGAFAEEPDGTKRVVVFLPEPVPAAAFAGLDPAAFGPERWVLRGREIFLHLPNGQGRAKLPVAINRITGSAGTARNWKTVQTLHRMASDLDRT